MESMTDRRIEAICATIVGIQVHTDPPDHARLIMPNELHFLASWEPLINEQQAEMVRQKMGIKCDHTPEGYLASCGDTSSSDSSRLRAICECAALVWISRAGKREASSKNEEAKA